jgi:membrane-bound lytic murein transglycosylase
MNISDIITNMILETLEQSNGMILLQRNELANKIGCVPSQINYVITSRFTPEHGYIVNSKRGGGGYIKIIKISSIPFQAIMHVINSIDVSIDENSSRIIVQNLCFDKLITEKDGSREEIDKGALAGKGLELVYLDPVELFFMQVQGSGRVRLPDGTHLRLGYATKNGHPYTSIGKKLVELGEDKPKSMTMQGIKDWLRADKERGNKMMWENKSYVFFRLLDGKEGEDGPIGAQGVSLTPGRSLAVDPSFHALGLPVFVEAPAMKGDGAPFRRLMIAQDVGSAIKGVERGDIYWGSGDDAGAIAGKTLAPAEFIVLLPNAAPGV